MSDEMAKFVVPLKKEIKDRLGYAAAKYTAVHLPNNLFGP